MSYPTCFGGYDYEYTCFRCSSGYRCLEHTKVKERMDMNNCFGKYNNQKIRCFSCIDEDGCKRRSRSGGIDMKEETKEERKARLDSEWEKRLPCANCHPKMQRLCKCYNTFKRPDYNYEQFNIGEITCDDRVDPPMGSAVEPLMSSSRWWTIGI